MFYRFYEVKSIPLFEVKAHELSREATVSGTQERGLVLEGNSVSQSLVSEVGYPLGYPWSNLALLFL